MGDTGDKGPAGDKGPQGVMVWEEVLLSMILIKWLLIMKIPRVLLVLKVQTEQWDSKVLEVKPDLRYVQEKSACKVIHVLICIVSL